MALMSRRSRVKDSRTGARQLLELKPKGIMKLILTKQLAVGLVLSMGLAALSARAAVGTLSGPFAHRNLQVFLVHGDTRLEDRRYATLSEALARGYVLVKETANVQELTVENQSGSVTVFLNAGDIVKGGRQDRTVRDDLILPPRSGLVPLGAFCVEHGRWTQRGQETAANFWANNKLLSSRQLKMAARYDLNQRDVWSGVAEQQSRLNSNLSAMAGRSVDTRRPGSSSSLQLTLESKDLDLVRKGYLDALGPVPSGKTDVIGFVYAINGEINSAEVYNNKGLFRALWPKLLESAVTEAITDWRGDGSYPPVEAGELRSFFETAVSGTVKERQVWKTTLVNSYTAASTVLFETLDLEANGQWLHKSFIHKGKPTVVVPLDRP